MVNSSLLSECNDAHWWCEDLENDLKRLMLTLPHVLQP
jgi:hypothetical protein